MLQVKQSKKKLGNFSLHFFFVCFVFAFTDAFKLYKITLRTFSEKIKISGSFTNVTSAYVQDRVRTRH